MELEEFKKQKLLELQQEFIQKKIQEQLQIQEQVDEIEAKAKQYMSPDAIARYGNLKAVHTEKAIQSLIVIMQFVQQGKIKEKVSDDQYKALLQGLTPEKKPFTIRKK